MSFRWGTALSFLLLASSLEAGPVLKMDRPQVNVRADATVQSSKVMTLAKEVEVEALGRKDEWFRIRLPDGNEGWVHSRLVQEIVVVTGEAVRLRQAGSTNAPTVATVDRGTELGKVGEQGNWFEVVLGEGERVWIWKKLVRPKTMQTELVSAALVEEESAERESVVAEEPDAEEESVEQEPATSPPLRRNLYGEGLRHAAAGEYEEALARFNEVLQADPDHLDALVHAARAQKELGVYDQALDLLYHAMEIEVGRRDIYLTLAEVYRLGGVNDSTAKYQAFFRGEEWEKPLAPNLEPVLESRGKMPPEAWWIYAALGLGVLVLMVLGGFLVMRRSKRSPAKPAKASGSKKGKSKFAKQMRQGQSREIGAGVGEEGELDRQILRKREDLQESSAAFLGPDALAEGGGEDAQMEKVLEHVDTLRKALEAQDERALVYADIVRLQNAKIETMERELELLRKRQ